MTSRESQTLIDVLVRARRLLLLSGNNFTWSRWADAEAAARDIDGFVERLANGPPPPQMDLHILFAPTGSIQEVSVSSGWGDAFISLSMDFDRAMEEVYGTGGG